MARYEVLFIFAIFMVLFGWSSQNGFECTGRSCNDEINSCLQFISAAIKGMEPLRQFNESVCKVIEITGLSSIRGNNKSCITESEVKNPDGPCFHQVVELKFEKLRIGCQLHSDPATTAQIIAEESLKMGQKAAADAAGAGMKAASDTFDAGKKAFGLGKREAEDTDDYYTFYVNGTWSDLLVYMEMTLCFDGDVYNVTELKLLDEHWNGLKLWCDGKRFVAEACDLITRPEFMRWLFGLVVNILAKGSLQNALADPNVSQNLVSLNCGEDYGSSGD